MNRSYELSMTRPGLRTALVALLALGLVACGSGEGTGDEAATDQAPASEQAADADEAATAVAEGKDKDGKGPRAVPVEVAQVERRSLAASYVGTATLEAPRESEVVAKTSGVLLELEVEEGDRVRAGQVLARIDPERARLEVARAEAALRKLEAEYERSKELFERKLVAADAHERIRYDVATQRAAWDLAKLELSYTAVEAPISGVIAQRMVKAGNLVQLNEPMFRIVDDARLEAVLNVPEREFASMRDGLPVRMQVDAVPGTVFEGEVDRVSPVIDAGSGTFRVTAAFDGSAGQLRPGMFGRLSIVHDRREQVLTVPRSALLEDQGEAAVFAVREGKAVRVPVQLGYVNGEYAEVRSGIDEGSQVVTTGKVALRDGALVEVLGQPPAAVIDPAATAQLAQP